MKIEAGKAYRSAARPYVYIMGPTRTTYPALWSLQGDHYAEDGRMYGYPGSRRQGIVTASGLLAATRGHYLYGYESRHTLVEEVPVHASHDGLAAREAARGRA